MAVFLAYANSFTAPFLFDNDELIVNDARVHANTGHNLALIFGAPYHPAKITGLYRPLTTYSFLLNYAILGNGVAPEGYHWLNFLIHAATVCLVYALLLVMIGDGRMAAAGAALWGVHPITTEAVVNIVGRADLLSSLGVLGCILAVWAVATVRIQTALGFAAIVASSAIAAGAKETGIIAAPAAALFAWTFLRKTPLRLRLAAIAVAAVPAITYLVVRAEVLRRSAAGPFPFVDNPLIQATFLNARLTAFKVIVKGFALLLWPARLSADYSYDEIPVAADFGGVFGLALCVGLGAAALHAWRHHKPLFFAIVFYFLALAPVSNVFLNIGAVMAERFLYTPAIGFFVGAAYGLHFLTERNPRSQPGIAIAVCAVALVCAARTHERNDDWSSGTRLWGSAVEAAPGSFKTHLNYAAALPKSERERALAEMETALRVTDPLPDIDKPGPLYQIAGSIYRQTGDDDRVRARAWYEKALNAFVRWGAIQSALEDRYRAMNASRGVHRASVLGAVPYLEIARTYARLGRPVEALASFEKGRALEPNPDLLSDEGDTVASLGDYHGAAKLYVEALELDSSRTQLSNKIIDAYRKNDARDCSIQGGALNLACPIVRTDICEAAHNIENTYTRNGFADAAASIRRVAATDLGCPAAK